jgi:hypothetical protein
MESDKVPELSPRDWQSIEEWGDQVDKCWPTDRHVRFAQAPQTTLRNNLLFEIAIQLSAIREALERIAGWRG